MVVHVLHLWQDHRPLVRVLETALGSTRPYEMGGASAGHEEVCSVLITVGNAGIGSAESVTVEVKQPEIFGGGVVMEARADYLGPGESKRLRVELSERPLVLAGEEGSLDLDVRVRYRHSRRLLKWLGAFREPVQRYRVKSQPSASVVRG
ncbi:MAG: hypothetical protein ACOC5M_02365 [Chloroflexota bacterium]